MKVRDVLFGPGRREWPERVNGFTTRPRYGSCPECGAGQDRWCAEGCTRLDPMDYR